MGISATTDMITTDRVSADVLAQVLGIASTVGSTPAGCHRLLARAAQRAEASLARAGLEDADRDGARATVVFRCTREGEHGERSSRLAEAEIERLDGAWKLVRVCLAPIDGTRPAFRLSLTAGQQAVLDAESQAAPALC